MQGNYRYELPQLQLKSFLTECREINPLSPNSD